MIFVLILVSFVSFVVISNVFYIILIIFFKKGFLKIDDF